jgi:hypothetical protein
MLPLLEAEVRDAKYSTRAWTLQEHLLGGRLIYFGKHEVHYRCMGGRASRSESIDDSIDPARLFALKMDNDAAQQQPANVVSLSRPPPLGGF